MRVPVRYIVLILITWQSLGLAQIRLDFNQSINQIGDCWQVYNMAISTQNTINRGPEKKALVGNSSNGAPAYYLQSPLLQFNGQGNLSFQHKLSAANGQHRELQVLLLDTAERLEQLLYRYRYIDSNGAGASNPTATQNINLPISFSGAYFLKFQFISQQGSSVGIMDNIYIDAIDISNSDSANAYGYCRVDDVFRDTICPGENLRYTLPYPIPQSSWEWQWQGNQVGGFIDTTLVRGAKDSLIDLQWSRQAQGDYILQAIEVRPPFHSRDYKVEFRVHVLARPRPSAIIH